MWAMAHRWRYAWHSNLVLQLLWLPYDTVTKQYGLLALGAALTFVSIKACLGRREITAEEERRAPRHRRPRGRARNSRRAPLTGTGARLMPPRRRRSPGPGRAPSHRGSNVRSGRAERDRAAETARSFTITLRRDREAPTWYLAEAIP
jgi:hypothetical protein